MDMGELLARDAVMLRAPATSKRQAMMRIAELAARGLGLSTRQVLDRLLEREALGSTGLGGGVAAPHARIAGMKGVLGVFVRLEAPVAFQAVDDRPVDLLFGLFAPPEAGAEHLRALAVVCRSLRSPSLRQHLRQARTEDAVRALFVRGETAASAA